MTSPLRVFGLTCALALGAAPLPARAQPLCGSCRPAYRAPACYCPCERVGPVRRVLRRVFRPCCPPPAPVCAVPVVAFPAAPVMAPRVFVPAPPVVVSPPADLGRPIAPVPETPAPPPPLPPASSSSLRRVPPPLTPPLPPPAVRVERIAAAPAGADALLGQVVGAGNAPRAYVQLTLVHAERPGLRRAVTADAAGRFAVQMAPGAWRVYTHGQDGRAVLHGTVEVRAHQACKVTVVGR